MNASIPKIRNRLETSSKLTAAWELLKSRDAVVSISSVAREAGVTPGLIHNTYPLIAAAIRENIRGSERNRLEEMTVSLKDAREKIRILRAELLAAGKDIKKLASINETLRQRLDVEQAMRTTGNITLLRSQ